MLAYKIPVWIEIALLCWCIVKKEKKMQNNFSSRRDNDNAGNLDPRGSLRVVNLQRNGKLHEIDVQQLTTENLRGLLLEW